MVSNEPNQAEGTNRSVILDFIELSLYFLIRSQAEQSLGVVEDSVRISFLSPKKVS